MEKLFEEFPLGTCRLRNRFLFPPIKLGYGNPDGTVTDRQLLFYRQISKGGPGVVILEPVSVTPEGREHPRQPYIHLPASAAELKKIVDVIHEEHLLVCLHLNHAGGAANPVATKTSPKAPSSFTCPASGQESDPLNEEDIKTIIAGYKSAAEKALEAGFDMIEVQAGHGYLVSQFLNRKINKRKDSYGQDRLLFAREALSAVREGGRGIPMIVRISGNEMSEDHGIGPEDLLPFLKLAKESGACAIHVGMGSACFSPPWYFHHASLPEKPQMEALAWVRRNTSLPLIVAGRMGRVERIESIMANGIADLVAIGRPLIADPYLIEKWKQGKNQEAILCGYCLQGCLHRVKTGQPLGCNVNPEIGSSLFNPTKYPRKILVAGGGPAGMSAALYLTRRGHSVTLFEKEVCLGGQFALAWQAPGKEKMKDSLESIERSLRSSGANISLGRAVDASTVKKFCPDLLVWATGAVQNIPDIPGLKNQHTLTSVEYFTKQKAIKGPRVLVIGAGRTGLEIVEKLGGEGYEVVATKRTDPIGSMMEMITRNLTLKRIGEMGNVVVMPHTTVKAFLEMSVDIEQDGVRMSLEPFQTVVVASGMIPTPGPDEEIRNLVSSIEIIGDAREVLDIFSAMRSGYELATKY
ncbi:MAG: FAD-dependent oxidoreductase [Deltaproteobacteria bacterium]|nr:FAD-dependent oxidoreductase [Deltaproteobacteria bacterium]MBW2137673.1 FAD-dependent oxidoreductase [Deltaproteobacteria bacterium]